MELVLKNHGLINATDLNIWNAVYLPQDRQRFICSFFCEQLCYYETIFKRYLKKYLIASSSFENVDNTNDADDVDAQTSFCINDVIKPEQTGSNESQLQCKREP